MVGTVQTIAKHSSEYQFVICSCYSFLICHFSFRVRISLRFDQPLHPPPAAFHKKERSYKCILEKGFFSLVRKIVLFCKWPLFTFVALKHTCSCLLRFRALGDTFLEIPVSLLHATIAGEKKIG